jgi:hypothetical protein
MQATIGSFATAILYRAVRAAADVQIAYCNPAKM